MAAKLPAKKVAAKSPAKKAASAKPPAKRAPRTRGSKKPAPLIDEQSMTSLVAAIEVGMEPERAALAVGVDVDLLERARKVEPQIQAIIDQALAVCELRALCAMRAGDDGWQAFRWLLERKYPERYGFTQFVGNRKADNQGATKSTTDDGVVIDSSQLERLRREREERARAAGASG